MKSNERVPTCAPQRAQASATLFTHTYAITRSERSTMKGCFIFFSVILGSSIVSVRIAWYVPPVPVTASTTCLTLVMCIECK
ncbi:hypothetical protein F2P81_025959 [Scophthalmus maximus]|uniref:Uncharacterized protein n=1 Tax=Scophthalmus maximus TaxID=52904 RepID=A0A6A4RNN2_SCOMX|nr:hypothetical protein F2P81_025959 [Scophthalmus maximus]